MIENWDQMQEGIAHLVELANDERAGLVMIPLDSVRLQPPLAARRSTIFALGGNVAAHMVGVYKVVFGKEVTPDFFLKEKRDGLPPWGFPVMPETIIGPGDAVRPPGCIQKLDYGCEVVAILKNGGRNLRADELEVWGYTVHNDFGIRDNRLGIGAPIHRGAFNWCLEKNFVTAKSFGPWIVVDARDAAAPMRCRLRVNGYPRQDWSTSEMIWSFGETAEFISSYIDLAPGDVICSGTGQGTALESGRDGDRWLRPGDKVEAEVEGIGVLRNSIAAWQS